MSEDAAAQPVLACRGLHKTYHDARVPVPVLLGVDLEVAAGEVVAIVGASGSGKSTLLHLLGGLDEASGGEVEVLGRPMSTLSDAARGRLRNEALGFVYQFHHLLMEFSALENVAMPLLIRRMPRADAYERAAGVLREVGLGERLDHVPGQLSGGERQRAAVARALVTQPRLVLADEPTGNLDGRNAEQVFALMLELNREFGTALVVVTHDARLAARMDRVERRARRARYFRITAARQMNSRAQRPASPSTTAQTRQPNRNGFHFGPRPCSSQRQLISKAKCRGW
jgi:lipoprotein-releasing system ATP-binding protein